MGLIMSIDAHSSVDMVGNAIWSAEEDLWEPSQPVIYALKIIDLIATKKDPERKLGLDRELRLYISKWISSLKLFRYDNEFAGYIVMNGLPESLIERVEASLEDLMIATSIILSEDRVPLSDAISYMDLLEKTIGIRSRGDYISQLILRRGRLSDIASRIALAILYIISYYIASHEHVEE